MINRLKESHLLVVAQYLTLLLPLSTIMEKVGTDILGSVVAVIFLLRCALFRKWEWLDSDWVRLGLGFWAIQILSSLWAYNASTALTYGFIWGRFLFFGIALAYWVLNDEKMHKKLFASAILAVGCLSFDALYQYYSGIDLTGNPKYADRLTGPFSEPRLGAAIFYFIIPLMSYLIATPLAVKHRILYALLTAAATISILLSGDRSPAVLLLLGFGLLFIIAIKNKKTCSFLIFLSLVAAGLIFQLKILDRFSSSEKNYVTDRQLSSTIDFIGNFSQTSYGLLFQDTVPVIQKHMLLGVGAGNFRIFLCQMNNINYFTEGCPIHPHNTYLDIWASMGLVGLVIYSMLLYAIMREFYRNFSTWGKDPLTIGLVITCLIRFWPIIFATAYTRSYSGFTFWLVIGWALNRIYKKHPPIS